jgi:hypothetical protein
MATTHRQILITVDKNLFQTERLENTFSDRIIPFQNIPVVKISCSESDVSIMSTLRGVLYAFDPLFPENGTVEPADSNPSFDQLYINILEYLDRWSDPQDHEVKITNFSQAPPNPYSYNELEPMNVATREVSKNGHIIVVAVGNGGSVSDKNMISPWSVADWVIGVGAAEQGGRKIWKNSSAGVRGSSRYRPWVVAPGVDISVPSFYETGDKFHGTGVVATFFSSKGPYQHFQIESGTSYAVPCVARLVSYMLSIIRDLKDMIYCWPVFFNWHETPNIARILIKLFSEGYELSYPHAKSGNEKFDLLKNRIHTDMQLRYGTIDEDTFLDYFTSMSTDQVICYFTEGQTPIKVAEIGRTIPIFDIHYLKYLVQNANINTNILHDSFTYIDEVLKHIYILSRILPNFTNYREIPTIVKLNQIAFESLSGDAPLPYDISVYSMKRCLAEMAQRIPHCPEHKQGHGYVDDSIFLKYFCSFGVLKLKHFIIDGFPFQNLVELGKSFIFQKKYILSKIAEQIKVLDANVYKRPPFSGGECT